MRAPSTPSAPSPIDATGAVVVARYERRGRFGLALLCLALVAVPFLVVQFPPLTDLPQHAAQIRLLLEAVHDPASPYAVQWLTPYGLSYAVLGLMWGTAGPVEAGRLAFLCVALLWVSAVHWLAAIERRSAAFAVLASLVVFNHGLYWGFFPFLFGWPLFVLFLRASAPEGRQSFPRAALLVGLSIALYLTHALWFAFAALWMVVDGVRARLAARDQVRRLLFLAPVGLLAVWWFGRLQSSGFETGTAWISSPPERLAPAALVDGVLGGLRGSSEVLVLGFCALAAVLSIAYQAPRSGSGRAGFDRRLAILAGTFFVLYLILPLKFQNTIRFAERWLPYAAVSLLLALPAPRRGRAWTAAALVAMGLFCGSTTLRWMAFDTVEMAGMRDALEALPEHPRVVGLSYAPQSALFKTLPFLQDFAYAQVRHGGELSFSFADYAPSLVVYRPPRPAPWTSGLQFAPQRVTREDLDRFSFVLVQGTAADQERVSRLGGLTPLTASARWRLYGRVPAQNP